MKMMISGFLVGKRRKRFSSRVLLIGDGYANGHDDDHADSVGEIASASEERQCDVGGDDEEVIAACGGERAGMSR